MYQSLYRKYRPRTFDEVVGQKVIIKILKNAIQKKKVSHAYLFSGPRGTGKTSVAKIFAKTVNCENLKDIIPCDRCVCCTQIKNKQSVDIIEIDAASNNGVDEIRELKSKISLVPSVCKYKVYIIDEVHMLTPGAFNALLKTLEEPPAHIIFILATTEPHKIPETILSRCQKFEFKKIDDRSMANRLNYICNEENIKIDDQALKEIIRFSSGGIRDAICLLEQSFIYSDSKITIEAIHQINGTLPQIQLKKLIKSIIDKDLIEIFNLIEIYEEKGKDLIKLIEEIMAFFKNLIIYKNIDDYFDENISREIFIDLSDKITVEEIKKIILIINNSLIEMKNYGNAKMVFELLMISLVAQEDKIEIPIEIKKEVISSKININNINCNNKELLPNLKCKNKESLPNFKKENQNLELLSKIKEIRINNTFSNASRSELNKIKESMYQLKNYILDDSHGKTASLLMDAKINAASSTNVIFVFPSSSLEKKFNNNILKIESFISKLINKQYNAIAVNEEEWEGYRREFKSKSKQYKYIEETVEIKDFLKNQIKNNVTDDKIHNLFRDLIVYDKKKEGIK